METNDLSKIRAEDFEGFLNQTMVIHFSPGHAMDAELVEVEKLVLYSSLERESFSIIYRTNGEKRAYQQGIYGITHPIMGQLDLFLVPIGPDQEGMLYQVIFS